MTTRRSIQTLFATLLVGLLSLAGAQVAQAYDFPSTNDTNRANGWAHVNLVETGPGTVTLEFVQPRAWAAYFEVRIDGQVVENSPHPFLGDSDNLYPGVGVGGGYPTNVEVREFNATSTVEVRLALGAENDEYFDWTTFEVGPLGPQTKDDCKNGGWETYGFKNQGQCVSSVVARR